ncbi:MAG: phosphoglycolate phosphatase [Salinirussus sp.]
MDEPEAETGLVGSRTQVPSDAPPLVADIDGTLTDDRRRLDPRVIPVLRDWPTEVVVATGKALPYAVAICDYVGIEPRLIAENGGIVLVGPDDEIRVEGDREAAEAVVADYRALGHDLGWGATDLVNRWRETELAVSIERPVEPLRAAAADHGLVVVDTGYAYHVTSPDVDKGEGLATVTDELGREAREFVAVGDSENDVPVFEAVGHGVAVANADDAARAAADHVTSAAHGAGFVEAVDWLIRASRTRS